MPTKLQRYVEWMSRGRLTGRIAFTTDPHNVPEPMPGAEWQLDSKFKVADALLKNPDLKVVIKAALDEGVAVMEVPAGRGPA